MAEVTATETAPVVTPAVAAAATPAVDPAATPVAADPAKAPEPPKTIINEPEPAKEPAKEEPKAPEPFDVKQLKLPEGFNAEDPSLGKFGEIIGNDKLSAKERGEALLNLYAEGIKSVGDANTKVWTDLQTEWRDQIKADPEFGGDKLTPTTQTISKAIDTLGPELAKSFRQALDFTGAGNNPAIIKGMAKFAAILTEGGHVPGGPGTGKQSVASVFFPNSPEFSDSQKGSS